MFCVGLGTPSHAVAMFEIGQELRNRGHTFSWAGKTTTTRKKMEGRLAGLLGGSPLGECASLCLWSDDDAGFREVGQWDRSYGFPFVPLGEGWWSQTLKQVVSQSAGSGALPPSLPAPPSRRRRADQASKHGGWLAGWPLCLGGWCMQAAPSSELLEGRPGMVQLAKVLTTFLPQPYEQQYTALRR